MIESKELTVSNKDQDLISTMRNVLYPGSKQESVDMVLAYCKAAKIDPLLKVLHIVPMSAKDSSGQWVKKDTVMPGIGLYRMRAERSGAYVGMSEPEFGPPITWNVEGVSVTYPEWCKITVKRLVNGFVSEFTAKEYWIENYATADNKSSKPNKMWAKRPYGQLAKCTESQSLRKAFSEIVPHQPTFEEMEGKFDYIEQSPQKEIGKESNVNVEENILKKIDSKVMSANNGILADLVGYENLEKLSIFYVANDDVKDGIDKYLEKLNLKRMEQLTASQAERLICKIIGKYPEANEWISDFMASESNVKEVL